VLLSAVRAFRREQESSGCRAMDRAAAEELTSKVRHPDLRIIMPPDG
jgi:hypothetical protein